MEHPRVGISIVISRSGEHPDWVETCIDSAKRQTYPNIYIVEVDNNANVYTIGKCYNDSVKRFPDDTKYILFLNDDDYISPGYISDLVGHTEHAINNPMLQDDNGLSCIVGASSYVTMFEEKEKNGQLYVKREPREMVPIGMWMRDYLLANRFPEYQLRYVDSELMQWARKNNWRREICYWNYGYHYRSHDGQVSYKKRMLGSHAKGQFVDSSILTRERDNGNENKSAGIQRKSIKEITG
jgi:cellulose synthase/poly-beta-1,6-N-acetylglucosamine synthase-like glycosyltransferase